MKTDIAVKKVEDYFHVLPEDRQLPMQRLRQVILDNLPEGFEEALQYKMPAYNVPHSIYPEGYHCDPKEPLPFMAFASQKNFIALYHSGLYAMPDLNEWWKKEYAKAVPTKLDMGKSCVRFKKFEHIPYDLIGELVTKVKCQDWINFYVANVKR